MYLCVREQAGRRARADPAADTNHDTHHPGSVLIILPAPGLLLTDGLGAVITEVAVVIVVTHYHYFYFLFLLLYMTQIDF